MTRLAAETLIYEKYGQCPVDLCVFARTFISWSLFHFVLFFFKTKIILTFWKKVVTEGMKFQIKQIHLCIGSTVYSLKF